MNNFAIIFLHLLLISSTIFVQSQFAGWSGTYSIVNTANSATCNQAVCCCFTGPITITMAALSISFSSNIQGTPCNNNMTSATFPTPAGYVIVPSYIGFTTTDSYILTLSSDSNTLTINDTTNQQCGAITQRVTASNGTSTVSNTVSTSSSAITTIPQNATITMGMTIMNGMTSQPSNGDEKLRYGIGCYLFLSLLASMVA